jgi:NO-binding membrane sensor protein with MHYT domain
MYRVLTCLTTQHDYRLLALAIIVCVVESFVALYVYWQVCATRSHLGKGWLGIAGLCIGGSIWATHFIAILAYDGGVPTAYEPVLTLISLFVTFILTTFGLALASSGRGRSAEVAGGAVIGVGIAVMHLIGMKALTIAGTIHWDYGLLTAGIAFGILLTAAAMLVFHEGNGIKGLLTATGVLVTGIVGMHSTAMAAVTIVPEQAVVVPALQVSNSTLALIIVGVTMLVLSAGFIASIHESGAARQTAQSTRELVNAATDALVLARDGVIVDTNGRVAELRGSGEEDLRGWNVFGNLLLADPVSATNGVVHVRGYPRGSRWQHCSCGGTASATCAFDIRCQRGLRDQRSASADPHDRAPHPNERRVAGARGATAHAESAFRHGDLPHDASVVHV